MNIELLDSLIDKLGRRQVVLCRYEDAFRENSESFLFARITIAPEINGWLLQAKTYNINYYRDRIDSSPPIPFTTSFYRSNMQRLLKEGIVTFHNINSILKMKATLVKKQNQ